MLKDLLSSNKTHAQFIRYFFVAGIGLVVDFSTVIFTKEILNFNYLVAACSGFILGLIVTYFLSNLVVFGKPKGNQAKVFILFALVGVVGLGILSLLMWLFTGKLGFNYIVSKAIATIAVFIWNFFARKSLYKDNAKDLPYEL